MDNQKIADSELILNDDGSIYHLNLKPEQLAPIVITVGDPERVAQVSAYFDHIEHKVVKREFHTHTGFYKGKRLSVISTGIGTDNIDIVFNELDALVNIDFNTRKIKSQLQQLDIIRIGTTGAVQPHIAIDSFLISQRAVGFDSLLHWYKNDIPQETFIDALLEQINFDKKLGVPYLVSCHKELSNNFQSIEILNGTTITNVGFYGPQSRQLRLQPSQNQLQEKLAAFEHEGHQITNLEMETSGIYAMASLLSHRAVSLNAVLANRATGSFSKHPEQTVDRLIQFTLDRIATDNYK